MKQSIVNGRNYLHLMKSDNTPKTVKQILILAVIFGAFIGGLYLLFEVKTEEIDKGYKRPARENPYHAATLFLNQSGIKTTVIKGFKENEDLSQMNGTIIITDSRRHLSQQFHEKLYDWVERGGSLMLFAEPPNKTTSWLDAFSDDSEEDSKNDYILSAVGARVYEVETEAKVDQVENEAENTRACDVVEDHEQSACVEINFKGIDKPLYVEFMTFSALADDSETATATVRSKKGLHMAQYDIGDGLLTLVTDFHFWTNHHIQKNDHAFLLESFAENSDHVWFLSYGRSLTFLELIWKYAHFLILWLTLVLVLFLWRKSFRFGPILPGTETPSRKLMEHIVASSRFLWGKKKESYMIQQLQDFVDRRMKKKQPGYQAMGNSQKIEAIHRVTHISRTDIQQAFSARDRYKKSEFLRTVKALQMIGKKL